jgi:hypothetical protein
MDAPSAFEIEQVRVKCRPIPTGSMDTPSQLRMPLRRRRLPDVQARRRASTVAHPWKKWSSTGNRGEGRVIALTGTATVAARSS